MVQDPKTCIKALIHPSPPKATIDFHKPKLKSFRFEAPYDHINPIDNTNYYTHLIDAHE